MYTWFFLFSSHWLFWNFSPVREFCCKPIRGVFGPSLVAISRRHEAERTNWQWCSHRHSILPSWLQGIMMRSLTISGCSIDSILFHQMVEFHRCKPLLSQSPLPRTHLCRPFLACLQLTKPLLFAVSSISVSSVVILLIIWVPHVWKYIWTVIMQIFGYSTRMVVIWGRKVALLLVAPSFHLYLIFLL